MTKPTANTPTKAGSAEESPRAKTSLAGQASNLGRLFVRYKVVIFVLFLAAVYLIVIAKISSYSDLQPDPADTKQQISTATPRVNQNVAAQLKSLENNHVSVQTLFDQARQNPFSE